MEEKKRIAERRRLDAIKAQSTNPFGKDFPQEYQTPSIQREVKGFKPGDDLHHRAIITVYEPFFSGLTNNEKLAMVDELQSMGVMVGNNPLNFTPMSDSRDHQGGIHQRAADYGLQLKGDDLRAKGTEKSLSGEMMPSANAFFDKIRNSSFDQKIAALPDFVKYGQDEIDRILRDEMGYSVPTRQEQQTLWRQAVDDEHEAIVNNYIKKEAMKRAAAEIGTEVRYSAKNLNKLLKNLRFAGDALS